MIDRRENRYYQSIDVKIQQNYKEKRREKTCVIISKTIRNKDAKWQWNKQSYQLVFEYISLFSSMAEKQ
jgi:hypothetical protein